MSVSGDEQALDRGPRLRPAPRPFDPMDFPIRQAAFPRWVRDAHPAPQHRGPRCHLAPRRTAKANAYAEPPSRAAARHDGAARATADPRDTSSFSRPRAHTGPRGSLCTGLRGNDRQVCLHLLCSSSVFHMPISSPNERLLSLAQLRTALRLRPDLIRKRPSPASLLGFDGPFNSDLLLV